MLPTLRLAGGVAQNAQGAILLVHRNTTRRQQWELPGGKVEYESPQDTVRRKMRDGLGVTVQVGRRLGKCTFSEDGNHLTYTWFLAEITEGEPRTQNPDRHDRCDFFTLPEIAATRREDVSASLRALMEALIRGDVELPAW